MSRLMYDGINTDAVHIPANAQMVAGYVDGLYKWAAADWARFPNAIKVRIAVFATTNDGHVLDCEKGNATPAQSVDWVLLRRKAGIDPTVYCGRNTWWGQIRAAFQARSVPEPHYWVAAYNGQPAAKQTIPAGAIGLQFQDADIYDLSVMADYWPGIDPPQGGTSVILGQDDISTVASAVMDKVTNIQRGVVASPHTGGGTSTIASEILALPTRFDALTSTLTGINTKLSALSAQETTELQEITGEVGQVTLDPTATAAAVKAALQDPTVLKLLAHAIAVELHNDTPAT